LLNSLYQVVRRTAKSPDSLIGVQKTGSRNQRSANAFSTTLAELYPLQKRTVFWRSKQSALAGWKRRFSRSFFDTVFWRVFSKMRVAIYARVSTKDRGQDTENQLHQPREFAERHGAIYKIYTDQESGARPTGPNLRPYCWRPINRSSTWLCSGAWTVSAAKVL
jgi:hypothetical protein